MQYKAKKYYINADGNMVKDVRYKKNLTEVKIDSGHTERKNLKLSHLAWQNSGVTVWFVDDDRHLYPMSYGEFNDYLDKHPVRFDNVNIEFLQQGSVYSIGFVDNPNT